MKKLLLLLSILLNMTGTQAQNVCAGPRKMWASINNVKNASLGDYQAHTGKVLISWRMLPSDTWETSFYLYSQPKSGGTLTRVNDSPIVASTCWQLASIPTVNTIYYLVRGDIDNAPESITESNEASSFIGANAIDQLELDSRVYSDKLPYISIPLRGTHDDVCSIDTVFYQANDASVGDLDGDGEVEVVVKRLQTLKNSNGEVLGDGTGASTPHAGTIHAVIWDAYKLDGTFLWRIKGGPSVMLGNNTAFAIADFDGDGKCEMAIRTGEGTVFGDGTQIGDTNGDGITDYRTWTGGYVDHYNSAGPEFLSIIDGTTGKELARTDFISRDTSTSWGDNYWKRANSFRIGAACFDKTGLPSVVLGRGVYARSVLEAWDYRNGKLTRRWHVDTSDSWTGKDGNPSSDYAGQGNHAFNTADLDGDGYDEVMYGSMAIDHDGIGLWTTKLGHGDANHVGKFLPDRDGLQVYHCLESGTTQVALHDAATGELIWKKEGDSNNDMGRCLVSDIDPDSPGCEFWMYGSNAFDYEGTDLGYKPASCNMAIWFDGTLTRQLINENIIQSQKYGRTFTMYRYSESFINGTKSNPSWYGDIFGDWREEVIVPDATKLADIKIFSTWYPSDYKFPYLMSDHTYYMQTINQNIGYNQPNHIGYFLGTGMDFSQVPVGVTDDTSDDRLSDLTNPQIVRTTWHETDINVLYPTVAYSVSPVVESGTVKTPALSATFTSLDGTTYTVGSQSYSEDYSDATAVSGWTVSKNAAILSIANDNDSYGNYLSLSLGSNNSRWAYTKLTDADVSSYNNYRVEFDLAITPGNTDAGTEFCVMSKGGIMPNNYWENYVYNSNNGQNFLFDLTGTAKSTPQYYLNGTRDDTTPQTITIASGTWTHYVLDIDKSARTVSWTAGNAGSGTFNVAEGTSMDIEGVCLLATRKQASFKLDNISVTPTDTHLYSQDYEDATNAGNWQMNYSSILGTLTLETADTDYGNYIHYTQSGNGPRSIYTRFYTTGADFYDGCGTYRLEFDAKLKQSSGSSSSDNLIVIYGEGADMPKGNKAWEGDNWLFKLSGGNATSLYTADEGDGYTLDTDLANKTWYHYTIEVDRGTGVVSFSISGSDGTTVAQGIYPTEKTGSSLNAQGICISCGRSGSEASVDNISISIPSDVCRYMFTDPGTLTVTATLAGHTSTTASYQSEIGARVGSIGYATLTYPLASLDFSANDGLQLYTVKVDNGGKSVTTTETGSKVLPQGEAVLLKGNEGIYVAELTDESPSLSNNDLLPNNGVITGGSGGIYVLNKVNGKVGFYVLNATGVLTAGKGYLGMGGTLTKAISLYDDEPTAIDNINAETQRHIIYDLSGRKVSRPAGHGVFIIDGKKVVK